MRIFDSIRSRRYQVNRCSLFKLSKNVPSKLLMPYKSIARLLEIHKKPIIGYTYRSIQEDFTKGLIDQGLPVFQGPERAVRALKALVQYSRLKGEGFDQR